MCIVANIIAVVVADVIHYRLYRGCCCNPPRLLGKTDGNIVCRCCCCGGDVVVLVIGTGLVKDATTFNTSNCVFTLI